MLDSLAVAAVLFNGMERDAFADALFAAGVRGLWTARASSKPPRSCL